VAHLKMMLAQRKSSLITLSCNRSLHDETKVLRSVL
jgi:hypothetical protein